MKTLLLFFGVHSLLFFTLFGIEEIVKRFPNSKFHGWWRRNVIGEVDDHYPL
jgi:hypothetical protein